MSDTNDASQPVKRGRGRPRKWPEGERKPRPSIKLAGTKPEDIARWERDLECVRMRLKSYDWNTIVEELGYSSPGHAHDRFVRMLKEYPRDDVETARDQEIDRLDVVANELMKEIEAGNNVVRASEVLIKLMERRARLLGLDKPERKELTVVTEDAVDKAIREAREEMDRKASQAREAGIDLSAV
jgi:hypothetical protein